MKSLDERMAPADGMWVCAACGKTAEDQFGLVGAHRPRMGRVVRDECRALQARQHGDRLARNQG